MTNKILIDRAVVEQAGKLIHIEASRHTEPTDWTECDSSLRAALANAEQPAPSTAGERADVIERLQYVSENGSNQAMRDLASKAASLLQSTAQPVGEHSSAIEMAIAALKDLGSHGAYSASIAEPAIAALLQSAPVADDARTVWELTDEQIDVLVTAHGTGGWQSRTDMAQFARAIEAAHKIGGQG